MKNESNKKSLSLLIIKAKQENPNKHLPVQIQQ